MMLGGEGQREQICVLELLETDFARQGKSLGNTVALRRRKAQTAVIGKKVNIARTADFIVAGQSGEGLFQGAAFFLSTQKARDNEQAKPQTEY